MNTEINLSIKKPCSEKFDSFTPTSVGGFCAACQKEVIDFTKMSEEEIILYFSSTTKNTCGRFEPSQLKTYPKIDTSPRKSRLGLMRIGLMSLSLTSLFTSTTQAQHQLQATQAQVLSQKDTQPVSENTDAVHNDKTTIKVSGVVTDQRGEPLPGVSIIHKGTTDGIATDENGKFQFWKTLEEGDILVFSFVGLESKEVKITAQTPQYMKVVMKAGCELMGEVATTEVYRSKPTFWQRVRRVFK
jgi:hypothetical protein